MHVTGPVLYMVIGVFGELGQHVQRHVKAGEQVAPDCVMTQHQHLMAIHVLVEPSRLRTVTLTHVQETVPAVEREMKRNMLM